MWRMIFWLFVFNGIWLWCFASAGKSCKGDRHIGYSVEITSNAGRLVQRLSDVSATSCQIACCQLGSECTVAVLHQKKQICWLYYCPTDLSCDLNSHKDYVSYLLDSNFAVVDDDDDSKGGIEHRKELDGYEDGDSADKRTTTIAIKHSTAKNAELECQTDKDCKDVLVGGKCHSGYCMCRFNWKNKNGQCHEPCKDREWECEDDDSAKEPTLLLKYSRCIAVYNRCDGIKNCADGSDEKGCPNEKSETDDFAKSTQRNKLVTVTTKAPVENTSNSAAENTTDISSVGLASQIARGINNIIPIFDEGTASDTRIAIAAVVLAGFISVLAVFVVCFRICRASRLSFRRRRLAENVRRHGMRDVTAKGQRSVKHLFSTTEEEADALIPGSSAGNGMFLM